MPSATSSCCYLWVNWHLFANTSKDGSSWSQHGHWKVQKTFLYHVLCLVVLCTLMCKLTVAQQTCSSEWQQVMCGQIPFDLSEQRQQCCATYRPFTLSTAAAQVQATAVRQAAVQAVQVAADRPDLSAAPAQQPDYSCLAKTTAQVPMFSSPPRFSIQQQQVPMEISTAAIRAVKQKAMASVGTSVQQLHDSLRSVNPTSGFIHPGGIAGPAEIALMKLRIDSNDPLVTAALNKMLTGQGVPPKVYPGGWYPPTGTPLDYGGPYAVAKVAAAYGGSSSGGCPANYPSAAPTAQCAHISFVELDAQQAYRQALAYLSTGNTAYADNAQRILEAWATVNMEWGIPDQNGPLEAGWGCAAMARAMEILKTTRWAGFKPEVYTAWVKWVNDLLMPQMENYVYSITAKVLSQRVRFPHNLSNWHSTIADCWMAFGILSDDSDRYLKAIQLFHHTVADYLKFGRIDTWKDGHVLGQCTETMRDIYHSEFAMGGLLQVAEMAWQQDLDIYSSNDYALPAMMELHARILNAGKDSNLIPPGYKFYEDLPHPPAGTEWALDMQKQKWYTRNLATGAVVSWLEDGIVYIVGSKFLPTGWELGYNHYVGRVGMSLPETAKLLQNNSPDWLEFHWGQSTITHANTAAQLWRQGVDSSTVCQ